LFCRTELFLMMQLKTELYASWMFSTCAFMFRVGSSVIWLISTIYGCKYPLCVGLHVRPILHFVLLSYCNLCFFLLLFLSPCVSLVRLSAAERTFLSGGIWPSWIRFLPNFAKFCAEGSVIPRGSQGFMAPKNYGYAVAFRVWWMLIYFSISVSWKFFYALNYRVKFREIFIALGLGTRNGLVTDGMELSMGKH